MKPLWDLVTAGYPGLSKDLDGARSWEAFEALKRKWIASMMAQAVGTYGGQPTGLGANPDAFREQMLLMMEAQWAWRHSGRCVYVLDEATQDNLMALEHEPSAVSVFFSGCMFLQLPGTWIVDDFHVYGMWSYWTGDMMHVNYTARPTWGRELAMVAGSPHDKGFVPLLGNLLVALQNERLSVQTRFPRASSMHRAARKSRASVRKVELTPDYRAHWRTVLVGDASHPEQPEDRAPCRVHHVRPHTYRAWVKADEHGNPANPRYLDCERDEAEPRPGRVAIRLPRRGCVRGQGEPMPAKVARVAAPTVGSRGGSRRLNHGRDQE